MKMNKMNTDVRTQAKTKVNLISRRRWLQSAMAAFAMPTLEVFTMGKVLAQQTKPNFFVYYLPNGRFRDWWYPSRQNGKFTFPQENAPLQPWADRMAIGTLVNNAAVKSSPNAAHARGTSTVLTCSQNDMTKITNHISIDQIIANHIGKDSRFKSLHYTSAKAGNHPERCDVNGTACIYTKSVSWKGRGQYNAPITDIGGSFKQLFGEAKPTSNNNAVPSSGSMNSVLDVLTAESNSLKNALGQADQQRLEQYFEGLRSVERRIQSQGSLQCDSGTIEEPNRSNYGDHIDAFHDLMVLALSCGQTKVITYMIDYGLSNRIYDFLDIGQKYHTLTHKGSGAPRQQYRKIEIWQSPKIASFLQKMENTIGSNGNSLMDETVILIMPSMGDGTSHDHRNVVPLLLGGNSPLKTDGRTYPRQELAHLHVSLLDAYGIEGNFGRTGARFGDEGNKAIGELFSANKS